MTFRRVVTPNVQLFSITSTLDDFETRGLNARRAGGVNGGHEWSWSREWVSKADEEDRVILTWRRETPRKGVAGIAEVADADGTVIDHFALGVYSAGVRAGRRASLIDARELQGALAVHHALGPAVGRAADKVRETGANGKAVHIATLTIRSARGWAARVCLREGCVEKSDRDYAWTVLRRLRTTHDRTQRTRFPFLPVFSARKFKSCSDSNKHREEKIGE